MFAGPPVPASDMKKPIDSLAMALEPRYRIERDLGEGWLTLSYAAQDSEEGRAVIVQVVRPDIAASLDAATLVHELGRAASIEHPHVLPMCDWGSAGGSVYYVTPRLEGVTARDKLDTHGRAPIAAVLDTLTGVVAALADSHANGVPHLAVEPERVLFTEREVLLTDLGVGQAIAAAGGVVPFSEYRAPEQVEGESADTRTDIYQVGVLAYELLTGRLPHGADSITDLRADVPPELAVIVVRCLATDPAKRYPDAEALLEALAAVPRRVEQQQPDTAERIGPYRLIDVLGKGGMGMVYLAEQTEPVKRRVALKVIKLGMDTSEVLRRFEAERQALALLDHPHIAKVFEAGATETGRPYFAMELVQGEPITSYCDRSRSSVRERLEVFVRVCRATQHAHQKGIIHRDLKPSNVLVHANGTTVPTIIDFGLAKSLGDALTDHTLETAAGQVIGTPAYMSPEQVMASSVDTRSDVYSLGVMLYEILVGALPSDAEAGASDPVALREMISRADYPSPSARFESLGDSRGEIAIARGTEPASLQRTLRGDLDWIVGKALEREPARRYATAEGLARDIERHLAHEPVDARPPSVGYRVHKFVRRNKTGVIAGGLVAASLVAGLISTTTLWLRATQAEVRAEADALAAERVSDFLTELFEVANPDQAGADDISARELLDRGARRIELELGDQPAVRARLSFAMGEAYAGLGLYEDGIPLVRSAAQTRESILGPDDPTTLLSMARLSFILLSAGRYDEADSVASQAVERWRPNARVQDVIWSRALTALGIVRNAQGQYQEAESLLLAAIAATPPSDSLELVNAGTNLGIALADQGRYIEGVEAVERSVEILGLIAGEDAPRTILERGILAAIYNEMGRWQDAERIWTEDIEKLERIYGPDHINVGRALNNLATLLMQGGDSLGRAEAVLRRALDIFRQVHGPEHPNVLIPESNLSVWYIEEGRYAEAEPMALNVLDRTIQVHGEEHLYVAFELLNIGDLYHLWDKPEQALPYQERARGLFERLDASEHPANAMLLRALADVYLSLGRAGEGLPLVLRAQEIHEAGQGAWDGERVLDLEVHERILRALGRAAEADSVRDASLAMAEATDTGGR